ncbi:hypothetical protein GCM10027514_43270 [Azotobacter armeniacus]
MKRSQPGILATVPAQARHLFFSLESADALPGALDQLSCLVDGETAAVGLGESLL